MERVQKQNWRTKWGVGENERKSEWENMADLTQPA